MLFINTGSYFCILLFFQIIEFSLTYHEQTNRHDRLYLHEWENRVWPLLVSVEETLFEVALLDDDGELIEVGGLDVRGYTLLNETPPSVVEHPIGIEL